MPDHDFLFALDVADDADSGRMVGELCAAVLGHVGCAASAIAEIARDVHQAVGGAGANGARRCDIRFVAHDGAIDILVACAGRTAWQTTRQLPPP